MSGVSRLDGRYDLAVHRIRPYRGEFAITEGDRVLLRKEVGLPYDGLFGPDMDDVATWEEEACASSMAVRSIRRALYCR